MKRPPLERLQSLLDQILSEPLDDFLRDLDPMSRGYLEQMRQRCRRAGEPDDVESVLRSAFGQFADFVNDVAARGAKGAPRSCRARARARTR